MPATPTDHTRDVGARLDAIAAGSSTPADFFGSLLEILAETLPYRIAAVWGLNPAGVVERVAEQVGDQSLATGKLAKWRAHRVLQSLAPGAAKAVDPELADGLRAIVLPIRRDGRPIGVLEVLLASESLRENDELLVKPFVVAAERFAGRPHSPTDPLSQSGHSPESAAAVLEIYRSLDVEHTAMAIANESRNLLGADRVCVAVRRGTTTQVMAISGRERVATDSAEVIRIRSLAETVIKAGQPQRLEAQESLEEFSGSEPLIAQAVSSGARSIEAIPLSPEGIDLDEPADEPYVVGALIIEHFVESADASTPSLRSLVANHAAVALDRALQHERAVSSWPGRLFDRYFAQSEVGQAKRFAWRCLTAVALVAVVALIPTPYRIEARGRIAPASRSRIFAPTDGEVTRIVVQGGQQVSRGETLLTLSNDRLTSEIVSLEATIEQQKKTLVALEAETGRAKAPIDDSDAIRLHSQAAQTRIEIEGMVRRLEVLRSEEGKLVVRAPQAGRVTTFDPSRSLFRRPVTRGDALLEVMQFEGPWRLELDCLSSEYGHLALARETSPTALPIRFIVRTQPETSFQAKLARVGTTAETREDGGLVVPIEAAVDADQAELLAETLAGAEVVARIECGRKPLVYVLFGSVYELARQVFW